MDIDRLFTPTGYASFHPHSASPRRTAPRQPPTMDSFFRPWTLCVGDMIVPQFSLFGMDSKVLQGWYAACGKPMTERPLCSLKRLARKSKPEAVSELMSWKNAWGHYVRRNVVSHSGAKLIQRFLLNTMISRKKSDNESLRIGERIWKTDTSSAPQGKQARTGHMFEDTFQEHLRALGVCGRN